VCERDRERERGRERERKRVRLENYGDRKVDKQIGRELVVGRCDLSLDGPTPAPLWASVEQQVA
jgi:hypothetical protein